LIPAVTCFAGHPPDAAPFLPSAGLAPTLDPRSFTCMRFPASRTLHRCDQSLSKCWSPSRRCFLLAQLIVATSRRCFPLSRPMLYTGWRRPVVVFHSRGPTLSQCPLQSPITMPCTGAGLAGVFKWNINRSGPVMATVIGHGAVDARTCDSRLLRRSHELDVATNLRGTGTAH